MNRTAAFRAALGAMALGAAGLCFTLPSGRSEAQAPSAPAAWPAAVVLLAAGAAAAFAARRRREAGAGAVKVLGSVPLAQNQRLVTVKFGSRVLLLGQSSGQISTLAAAADPAEVKELEQELPSAAQPERPSPLAWLARAGGWARERGAAPLMILPLAACLLLLASPGEAQQIPLNLNFEAARSPQQAVGSLQVLLLMSVLAFAPALILMVTSFTRILIVLSLLRQAIGLPQIPPNQVIVALSLFLTLFVMRPQLSAINTAALDPYLKGRISHSEAFKRAQPPLREFMLAQTRRKDLQAFTSMSGVKDAAEVPLTVLIPSFVTSELKTAFQIGFLLFIPFLLVDMIVASILMSMGMVMIPPAMISMPFKLLLFVLIDGWSLTLSGLAASFR